MGLDFHRHRLTFGVIPGETEAQFRRRYRLRRYDKEKMSRYNRRIMSEAVPIHIAKAQLSKLIARAEAGEEIVITRRGKPVAKLVVLAPITSRPKRVAGSMRGQFVIGPEFFEPMSPEELDLWYK